MDVESKRNIERVSAINLLYMQGKITSATRVAALSLINPVSTSYSVYLPVIFRWLGLVCIMVGIMYLFTASLHNLVSLTGLLFIQLCIIACIVGAYHRLSLRKTLLYGASLLVGVHIWLFIVNYHITNIPPHYLSLLWFALIFGWTLISDFDIQWLLLLLVANLSLVLWYQYAIPFSRDMWYLCFACLALINGISLIMREYFVEKKGFAWLAAWTRGFLITVTVLVVLAPTISWILYPAKVTISVLFAGIIGLVTHTLSYYYFRYRSLDMQSLKTITLSICLIVDFIAYKILLEIFPKTHGMMWLLLGLATIAIFTSGVIHLQRIAKQVQRKNG